MGGTSDSPSDARAQQSEAGSMLGVHMLVAEAAPGPSPHTEHALSPCPYVPLMDANVRTPANSAVGSGRQSLLQ